MHGTVGPRRGRRAPGVRRPRRRRGRRSPAGSAEAALAHVREVAGLPGEHVEVAGEPRPGVQPAARRRPPAPATPGSAKSSFVERPCPARKLDHQHARGRAGSRRPRAPTPAAAAARVLACSASRSMPSSAGVAAEHAARRRSRRRRCVTRRLWLVSPPGSSRDVRGRPCQDRRAGPAGPPGRRRRRHAVSRRRPRRRPRRWCASGPVNQFLAETCHQIVEQRAARRA